MSAIEQALRLIQDGHYDEGLEALNRLESDPESRLLVLGNRAWLLRCRGRYEDAARDYEALCRESPKDTGARALLAETQCLLGDYETALKGAVALLAIDSTLARAADVVIRCHEALGHRSVPPGTPPFDRPTIPLSPPNPIIEILEKDPSTFPTSIYPEMGRLLYSFVRAIRPKIVVETGTFIGYSALCIAQAMEDNDAGHLHCFDLFATPPKNYISPVLGPRESLLEIAREHLERAGLAHRASLHPGDSSASIRRVFRDRKDAVDLAFIDGDHMIEGCLEDWTSVDEILKPGGIVFLHDTNPDVCGWVGPRHLLDGLRRRSGAEYPWIDILGLDRIGFAVLQKQTAGIAAAWKPSYLELLAERWFTEKHGKWD